MYKCNINTEISTISENEKVKTQRILLNLLSFLYVRPKSNARWKNFCEN